MMNIKEYSVSDISVHIKEILENTLGLVRIKGEISGLKIASSGHGYFNLKDDKAVLCCTCWRPVMTKLKVELKEGIEVIVTGKITAYAGQSRYQLSVEQIEASGIGALIQILHQRKEKLAQEGIFDVHKKRPLPKFPKKIGVITSLSGAVIRDIIHRIKDRFPLEIIIWPVTVQGPNAAREVADAILGFNNLITQKPDLLIIARGGGSVEDLWSFNEEIVVRGIANSIIPTISAIGHETDVTLSDFAADFRAPTPTAAAEIAVPVLTKIKEEINQQFHRIYNTVLNKLKYSTSLVEYYSHLEKYFINFLNFKHQTLDELSFRLQESVDRYLQMKLNKLSMYSLNFANFMQSMHLKQVYIDNVYRNLFFILKNKIQNFENQVGAFESIILSVDYNRVLKKGFAILRSDNGVVISSLEQIIYEQIIEIELKDGKQHVKITKINEKG